MRKYVLRRVAVILVISMLLTVSAFAETATITGSSVNFRSGPGSQYDVIGCFDYGTTVELLDTSNSYWYRVSYNGTQGYVYSAYVKVVEQASTGIIIGGQDETVSTTGTGEEGYINGMYVRFRSGPGSEYNILGEYNMGTPLTVTSKDSDWYGVIINGQSGYVHKGYIAFGTAPSSSQTSETTPVPVATPTPTPAAVTGTSGYINANSVNFRYGAGTGYGIIGTYDKGTAVTVLGTSNGWTQCVINGNTGYVYSGYVSLNSSTQPAVTPTPAPEATPTPTPAPAATGTSGYINASSVNFRYGAGTGYGIIGTYDKGTAVTVLGTSNGWTQCVINGNTGYVYSGYVTLNSSTQPEVTPTPAPETTPAPASTTTGESGFINGNSVRFRSGPSTAYDIIGTYNYGTQLTVTGVSGEWTQCVIDGKTGYVYSGYVTKSSSGNNGSTVTPGENSGSSTTSSVTGQQIANYALQYVGYPYVWGGSDPSGFDCSGFVKYVYSQFGYTLKRVACDQATEGIPVDSSNLQPGDILAFYSGSNYIGHVGIYIGNNCFVHASTYTTGVIISELSGYYNTRGFIARRIIY